jgi:hypothetical protein
MSCESGFRDPGTSGLEIQNETAGFQNERISFTGSLNRVAEGVARGLP